MRQREVQQAQTIHNIDFELDDEQEGVEGTSEPDLSGNEESSSREGDVLMEDEGTTMDNVNIEELAGFYQDPSPMEAENNELKLQEKHFTPYDTNEERLDHKPENIPINQFEELIDYWSLEQAKENSKNNKGSRELQDDVHTMGPSSFPLLRTQLQKKDPNNQPPCEPKEEMDALQSTYVKDGDGSSCSKEPYGEVIKSGRLYLYGRTVTKSKLKEVAKDKDHPAFFPLSSYKASRKRTQPLQSLPLQMSSLKIQCIDSCQQ
ncbi:hypothetical protein V2J09_013362 [Rumex salicifolius]